MLTDAMIEETEGDGWNSGIRPPSRTMGEEPLSRTIFHKTLGSAVELVPTLEARLGDEWGKAFRHVADRRLRTQQWFMECVASGYDTLSQSVDIDPEVRGGVPVLHGTGFTVAQALA